MLTVRHNGMSATDRFLGTACSEAALPQPLLSEARKDHAGNVYTLLKQQMLQRRRPAGLSALPNQQR